MQQIDPRKLLVEASLDAVALGLNNGTVGNFSLRHGAGMLITPSGIRPEDLQPDQMVEMTLDGNWEGRWKPSSEWAIHGRLYQNTTAGAVAHMHPDNCVAVSALRQPIPPFHYMVAGFGGNEIPCARYECFGSEALAEAIAETMGSTYAACLMANHGAVTIGRDLGAALARAQKLETLAKQYLLARSAGEPVLLTPEELAAVHARYGTYGQQPA